MKNLRSFFVLIAGMALMFMACSKGSAGPTGPQGPAGPDSVIHSPWISLHTVYSTTDSVYEQTITATAITQRILDSGIILTYISFKDNTNTTNVFVATPYFLSEIFTPGQIFLATSIDFTGFNYRYVIIAGTVTAGTITSGPAKGLTVSELRNMSYSVVQKLIGESPGKVSNQ
ncbi:MAG: hypothetical protein ACHQEM_04410 [Chitinophagales bacterium]